MNPLIKWGWASIALGSAALLWSWYRRAPLEDDELEGEWRLVSAPDEARGEPCPFPGEDA